MSKLVKKVVYKNFCILHRSHALKMCTFFKALMVNFKSFRLSNIRSKELLLIYIPLGEALPI